MLLSIANRKKKALIVLVHEHYILALAFHSHSSEASGHSLRLDLLVVGPWLLSIRIYDHILLNHYQSHWLLRSLIYQRSWLLILWFLLCFRIIWFCLLFGRDCLFRRRFGNVRVWNALLFFDFIRLLFFCLLLGFFWLCFFVIVFFMFTFSLLLFLNLLLDFIVCFWAAFNFNFLFSRF